MSQAHDTVGIGIESSCDETAVAVVSEGRRILSSIVSSQIDLHRAYCGVVPEIASRAHLEVINDLIDGVLAESGVSFERLDYVAVTSMPGLVGSLLVGLQSAKAIAFALRLPLVAVNHLEAHLYAPFLEGRALFYPFIGLLVSGGNTVLYHARGLGDLYILGRTVDDAVGEAFDKVAKFLNLGYPGGPVIERCARRAKKKKTVFPKILPDENGDYRFSYSGIKTAVITHVRENPGSDINELVYSFQERALELLVRRAFAASRRLSVKNIIVAGGVAANGRLRDLLQEAKREDETVILSQPRLCTDNAAMVAGLGYQYFKKGIFSPLTTEASARLPAQ
jgi:N6-L-threonylcarbamoyladenine synthase